VLILTLRLGEELRFGENVSVMVLDVHGNQVRLGIDAPKSVAVHRCRLEPVLLSRGILRQAVGEHGEIRRIVFHAVHGVGAASLETCAHFAWIKTGPRI
jgi:carbon storage regulator